MRLEHLVYDDNVVAVALVTAHEDSDMLSLALRWLEPGEVRKPDGSGYQLTNHMGGETDWLIIPFTFGASIGRTLVMQKAAGRLGFHDAGFAAMVEWLVDLDELEDAMCY
jgi:hypothetical protein